MSRAASSECFATNPGPRRAICVKTLRSDKSEISQAFGGRKSLLERLQLGDWTAGPHGIPVPPMVSAYFLYELDESVDVATHPLSFGRTLSTQIDEEAETRVYYKRCYLTV